MSDKSSEDSTAKESLNPFEDYIDSDNENVGNNCIVHTVYTYVLYAGPVYGRFNFPIISQLYLK